PCRPHQRAGLDALVVADARVPVVVGILIRPLGRAGQVGAVGMEDPEIPVAVEHGQHVAMDVERRAVGIRGQIARPRIVARGPEGVTHLSEPLAAYDNPHSAASPSTPSSSATVSPTPGRVARASESLAM